MTEYGEDISLLGRGYDDDESDALSYKPPSVEETSFGEMKTDTLGLQLTELYEHQGVTTHESSGLYCDRFRVRSDRKTGQIVLDRF